MPLTRPQARQLIRLGDAIRRERVARGLTQVRLSEKVDLNLRTVQKIEAGKTNILVTTIIRIQEALDCKWDDLLPN